MKDLNCSISLTDPITTPTLSAIKYYNKKKKKKKEKEKEKYDEFQLVGCP